jgi:5'-deoxynucleotidase YfbR-like HD superfamily hydrolase
MMVICILQALSELPRKGFKDRKVSNPETVYEHTEAVIALAQELFPEIIGLDVMLKIHDWMEFLTGDNRTDHLASEEDRLTPEQKKALELEAMIMICEQMGEFGEKIFVLWQEYEAMKTVRSQIAKQVDHTQAILRAWQYEQDGEPVIAKEFYDYYHDSITDPRLIKKMADAGIAIY